MNNNDLIEIRELLKIKYNYVNENIFSDVTRIYNLYLVFSESQESQFNNLKFYVSCSNKEILEGLACRYAFLNEPINKELFLQLYYFLKKYDEFYDKIEMFVSEFDLAYCNTKIANLFDNDINNILKLFNILTVKDLFNLSIESIIVIFGPNIKSLFDLKLIYDSRLYFDKLYSFYAEEEERKKQIFTYRYFYNLTLEEIGSKLNLSKERIRQILNFVNVNDLNDEINKIVVYLKLYMAYKNIQFIRIDEIFNIFINYEKEFACYIIGILNYYKLNITYFDKYKIVTFRESINNVLDSIKDKIGIYISKEKYETMLPFEKCVIDNHYKQFEDGYLLQTLNKNKLIMQTIDELFPNGMHIDDNSIYTINNFIMSKYGFEFSNLNAHEIQALLCREDYCLVDRGTYLNRKYVNTISNDLLEKILEYIKMNDKVSYALILNKFEDELSKNNINNRYYLKGVLDPYLNYKDRDYAYYSYKYVRKISKKTVCEKSSKSKIDKIDYDNTQENESIESSNPKILTDDNQISESIESVYLDLTIEDVNLLIRNYVNTHEYSWYYDMFKLYDMELKCIDILSLEDFKIYLKKLLKYDCIFERGFMRKYRKYNSNFKK